MPKFSTLLIALIIAATSYAQEVMVGLSEYPVSKPARESAHQKSEKASLELPFFDDFSRNLPYPTPELWEPSSVITSQTYAVNPPTIGVATFDAINREGELFEYLTSSSQPADTLTSTPINLSYHASDSIYLSLAIQPGGLGYQPGPNDSLVIEFFSPSENKWLRAWAASVDFDNNTIIFQNHLTKTKTERTTNRLDSTFFSVIINIDNPKFLQNGFRFQLIGYASLMENATVPGYRTNTDHWHVDLVYLNRNRNWDDTLYNDIAFHKPLKPLLKYYTSIPWSHFAEAQSSELPTPREFSITYHNLGPTTWNVTRRFVVSNLSDGNEYPFSGGAENIYGYQELLYIRQFDYNFTSTWADSAKYLLKTFLITDIDEATKNLRYNDTLTHTLSFYNYYALDDGSAESGYGLFGEGTLNAMVAQKFHNYKTDNLVGVMIYFNRSYHDSNNQPFKITIWNDSNGKPGEIIYQKSTTHPIFTDSLNCFTIYRIDPTEIPEGDFYLGWQQGSIDFLNVGFDRNTDSQSKIFHSLPGYWINTQFKGTIMIRPIFGKLYEFPTTTPTATRTESIEIYPNPASHFIRINKTDRQNITFYQIYSTTGQMVKSGTFTESESINVANLPEGIYLIKAITASKQALTAKVAIAR